MVRAAKLATRGRLGSVAACLAILTGPSGLSTSDPGVGAIHHASGQWTAVGSSLGWSSENRSGYAVTAGPHTSVTGTWMVTSVAPSQTATYSSTWIGIDGFTNDSLIQTGTDQAYYAGAAHYSAWWEILPAAGISISSLDIHAGNVMSATIARNPKAGTWTITLVDSTTGQTFTTVQRYDGPGASAEWIREAPTVGTRAATLATYSPITFQGSGSGGNPGLVAANGGAMVQGGHQVSTPSVPNSQRGSFTIRNADPPGARSCGPSPLHRHAAASP